MRLSMIKQTFWGGGKCWGWVLALSCAACFLLPGSGNAGSGNAGSGNAGFPVPPPRIVSRVEADSTPALYVPSSAPRVYPVPAVPPVPATVPAPVAYPGTTNTGAVLPVYQMGDTSGDQESFGATRSRPEPVWHFNAMPKSEWETYGKRPPAFAVTGTRPFDPASVPVLKVTPPTRNSDKKQPTRPRIRTRPAVAPAAVPKATTKATTNPMTPVPAIATPPAVAPPKAQGVVAPYSGAAPATGPAPGRGPSPVVNTVNTKP